MRRSTPDLFRLEDEAGSSPFAKRRAVPFPPLAKGGLGGVIVALPAAWPAPSSPPLAKAVLSGSLRFPLRCEYVITSHLLVIA